MKYIFLLFLLIILCTCNLSKQCANSDSELPVINLNIEYPEKSIDVNEIADVNYIPLETMDSSLIAYPAYIAMSDKYIVIGDAKLYKIFLFDKNGKYLRTIGEKGEGPEEYDAFYAFDVDFYNEEVFLYKLGNPQQMWVYSFKGTLLRKFKYDALKKKLDIKRIDNYNKDFLLAYNDQFWPSPYPEYRREADKTPYYLIDKHTGTVKVAHKQLVIQKPVPPYLDKMIKGPTGHYNWTAGYTLDFVARNGSSEYLLVDNSLDTLFMLENQEIKPKFIRTPPVGLMETKHFISPCALTDSFFLYRKVTLNNDLDEYENHSSDIRKFPAYILNRNTKEIYRLKLYDFNICKDLTLDQFFLSAFPGNNSMFNSSTNRNQIVSYYQPYRLLNNIKIENCKKEFKDICSTVKEDDNPVLVVYNFK